MKNVIAEFEYNQKKYVIKLIGEKEICFFKKEKSGVLNNQLSFEEKEIVNKVYDSLYINSDNSAFYGIEKIGINSYKIYIDKVTANYFWIPLNNNYNYKDNIKLNFKYNHELGVVYGDEVGNPKKNYNSMYSKYVKIGKKLVLVLVTASLSLNLLSGCTIDENDAKNISSETTIVTTETTASTETLLLETVEELEPTDKYSFEEIRQVIENNPYLQVEEKEILYKLQFVFDEYHDYMDMAMIKERLESFKIQYQFDPFLKKSGYYNYKENISILNANSFDEVSLETFLHEFFHVLQKDPKGYGLFTCELSNEFFTREILLRLYKDKIIDKDKLLGKYFRKEYKKGDLIVNDEEEFIFFIMLEQGFGSGYETYIGVYYTLAQILPKEVLLHYQFNPLEIDVLKNALLDIVGNADEIEIERVNNLISHINNLRVLDYTTNDYIYCKDDGSIFGELDYFYKLRTGLSISEDIELCSYLRNWNSKNFNIDSYLKNAIFFLDTKGFEDLGNGLSTGVFLVNKTILSNSQKDSVIIFVSCDGLKNSKTFILNEQLQCEYLDYIKSKRRS